MAKKNKKLENIVENTEAERLVNKQLVLEELRNVYGKKYSASDVLDGKLQNIFNFLNVVVSIAPTLEIALNPDPNHMSVFFILILLAIFFLYYTTFLKISSTLKPAYYQQPISNNWDVLTTYYFSVVKEQAVNRIMNEYLLALEDIGKKNDNKIRVVGQVANRMATIVILLLLAVPINIFLPAPTLADAWQTILQFVKVIP